MSVIRSLWAAVQGDPKIMRADNGWLTIVWLIMSRLSLLRDWVSSVPHVAPMVDATSRDVHVPNRVMMRWD